MSNSNSSPVVRFAKRRTPLCLLFPLLAGAFLAGCVDTTWYISTDPEEGVLGNDEATYVPSILGAAGGSALASSFLPEAGTGTPSPAPELKLRESDWLFEEDQIREYHLTMSTGARDTMLSNALAEEYSEAALKIGEHELPRVGLRYKGSDYSMNYCFTSFGRRPGSETDLLCKKLSLKLKFSEFDDAGRLLGLKKLDLLRLTEHSLFSNALGYKLFRELGITCSRTAFAKVYINGDYIGLYLATENVDGRFSKYNASVLGGGDGNIYKGSWPNGEDATYYLRKLANNDDPEDFPNVDDMVAFSRAVEKSTEDDFEQRMVPFIDLDHFTRYMVVDQLIQNWDGLTTWYHSRSPHNIFWVQSKQGGPFTLIPWDLDNSFTTWGVGAMIQPLWTVPQGDADCPPSATQPGCDKFLALTAKTQRKKYVEYGRKFLDEHFVLEDLEAQVEAWGDFTWDAIWNEPNFSVSDHFWAKGQLLSVVLPRLRSDFEKHLDETEDL